MKNLTKCFHYKIYTKQVAVVPSLWNCLSCERELIAFTRHLDASVESLSEFLSGDAFCAGTADPTGCEEQIGPFMELAVPSLAEALAANARTYCYDYSDCGGI